jgi:DNA-binding HxlR family transcriptional regulator
LEALSAPASGINGRSGENLHTSVSEMSACGPRAKCRQDETGGLRAGYAAQKPAFESVPSSPIPSVPPPKRHPYDQWSPDARALDLVGDKWTLLIIRDLAAGPRRFVELQRVLPGISTEQLRSRLNRMVADGLLTRQRYREVPPRVDYELTERSRELMPVVGALARWGYDWTWSAPRPGEDINVGAVFRLAPGLIEAPPGLEGSVDLVVEGEGETPERRYRLTASSGRVEISESAEGDGAGAVVTGGRDAWVRALGPDGSSEALSFTGNRGLADAVLGAFTGAAAARRAA